MKTVRTALGLAFLLAAGSALANTYTVTTTADSGPGSLRQAILDANANSGTDSIAFNIAGSGVHTIAPASPLPSLTSPVTIDGYTQPGASPNTNPPEQGLNSILQIEIDCTNAGTYCLVIGADDVTLRGLVINRGIGGVATDFFKRVQNPVVEGCFFGTTADGLTSLDLPAGITFGQHDNARIGGSTPAARNLLASTNTSIQVSNASDNGAVIQGNLICTDKTGLVPIGSGNGIVLSGGGGAGNTSNMTIGGLTPAAANVFACPGIDLRMTDMAEVAVQGNKFGVDPSGTKAISRSIGTGIYLENGGDDTVVIGGSAAGAGNVIGSKLTGITLYGGEATVIQGNFIGTDTTGTLDLGNAREGIFVAIGSDLTIGGVGLGEGNAILHNRNGGVRIAFGTGNSIRGNRIVDNHGSAFGTTPSIGIDIGSNGPDATDGCDADTGANVLQNFPIITSASPEGGGTRVIGTLDSTASSAFTLDFYSNPVCRARRRSQAQADQYLGSTVVSTNASCAASFNVLLPTSTTAGQPVTATATAADGSTSELTPDIIFSSSPIAGDAAGGTALTIDGMLFVDGATVSIGGTPATGVSVDSDTKLQATAPAKPAGTVHDIVVTLPGGITGTMRNGYVSRFNDVGGQFDQAIAKLSANQVTAGCGGGNYCPGSGATRAQMAVFLLRSKKGLCYAPPPATGTVFGDVSAGSFAAAWIEALAAEGVTTGCGGGNYCPDSSVTRAQMAVFILRMLEGSSYSPPPCTTATFDDVPCSNPFASWIEELVERGITAGCGFDIYCPGNPVTRGQMAVFLSSTFGLP